MSKFSLRLVMDTTENNRVYKMAKKMFLESRGDISCSVCPYHRGENFRKGAGHGVRCWKNYRKTQYKTVDV